MEKSHYMETSAMPQQSAEKSTLLITLTPYMVIYNKDPKLNRNILMMVELEIYMSIPLQRWN
jgi:uncharacterized membrane protein YbaN (DUF454 family)